MPDFEDCEAGMKGLRAAETAAPWAVGRGIETRSLNDEYITVERHIGHRVLASHLPIVEIGKIKIQDARIRKLSELIVGQWWSRDIYILSISIKKSYTCHS